MKIDIMPSEGIHKKLIERFNKLPDSRELPKPPFYIMIQGSVGSGKSSLLYSLMKAYQPKGKEYFDMIVVFNANKDSDIVFQSFEKHNKVSLQIFNYYDDDSMRDFVEEMNTIQEQRKADGKPPLSVLVVLDDMIARGISTNVNRPNGLSDLLINRRHINTSIIITSQSFKSLNKIMRSTNVSQFFLMRANNEDLISIAQAHNAGKVSAQQFIDMYNFCKSKGEYKYLVIDYQAPPHQIFKYGLEEIIRINGNAEEEEPQEEEVVNE